MGQHIDAEVPQCLGIKTKFSKQIFNF